MRTPTDPNDDASSQTESGTQSDRNTAEPDTAGSTSETNAGRMYRLEQWLKAELDARLPTVLWVPLFVVTFVPVALVVGFSEGIYEEFTFAINAIVTLFGLMVGITLLWDAGTARAALIWLIVGLMLLGGGDGSLGGGGGGGSNRFTKYYKWSSWYS